MKIYFGGSIRAGRDDQVIYHQLIQGLRGHGTVLTEHVGDPELTQWGDDGPSDQMIYQRDMAWLAEASLMVAEVTVPSLGVGYEISRAESRGIPVLCLYRELNGRKLSAMISGNPNVTVTEYSTVEEALVHIGRFIGNSSTALPQGD